MTTKKICFVSLANLYAVPYLNRYTTLIDCDYDIIYWNRHDFIESYEGAKKIYEFNYRQESSKFSKINGYLRFKIFAEKVLAKNSYDAVIILHTQAAILLQKILIKQYGHKYILDIRDYTFEKNRLYYNLEEKLLNQSGIAVISSKSFEKFLPKHNYYVTHNITHIPDEKIKYYRDLQKIRENKIVISCIGGIRFIDQFEKVISSFANDNRYKLRFIGVGANNLKNYILNNNIKNVDIIDYFPPDKTLDYYFETNIVQNLYGNNTPMLDHALSNKLYYAASLGMPILVCPGTYMEEISVKNGFGFTFDVSDPEAPDKLYEYYMSIDWQQFYDNCDSFMKRVRNENNIYEIALKKFVSKL